jgi:DNA-directed RNA polymerase specialized sigma54-like protein
MKTYLTCGRDRNAAETSTEAAGDIIRFDPSGVNTKQQNAANSEALNLQTHYRRSLDNMDELEKYTVIASSQSPTQDIMAAVKLSRANPSRRNFSSESVNYIVPDVYLIRSAEGYQIILNDEGLPKLKVSSFYRKLIQQNNAYPKEDKQFLIEKMRSAVGLHRGS